MRRARWAVAAMTAVMSLGVMVPAHAATPPPYRYYNDAAVDRWIATAGRTAKIYGALCVLESFEKAYVTRKVRLSKVGAGSVQKVIDSTYSSAINRLVGVTSCDVTRDYATAAATMYALSRASSTPIGFRGYAYKVDVSRGKDYCEKRAEFKTRQLARAVVVKVRQPLDLRGKCVTGWTN